MDREKAIKLLNDHLKNENLKKHCLATEACMRAFARHFGEDEDTWGIAGILHDLDYEYTSEDPDNHGLKTAEMLQDEAVSENVLHAIKAHNKKADISSKMDISLYTIDPTTGFITACALMHPSKSLEAVTLKRMKKRFKEKSFAKGADRDQIKECSKLDMELDQFLNICRDAMADIHNDLGL
ncbi:MAG: HD domain-containing protein [Acidobacteriota bacterium]